MTLPGWALVALVVAVYAAALEYATRCNVNWQPIEYKVRIESVREQLHSPGHQVIGRPTIASVIQ